jgi:hypothetical protein
MIRIVELSATPSAPYEPGRKLPVGPSPDGRDPGGRQFVAEWLAHVAVGNIGAKMPVNEEARAIVLANERLMLGRGGLGEG